MTMISDPTIYDTLTSEGKIGIHIFVAREKQGMSRKALAAKTGLSVSVIIAIEDLFKEKDGRRQTITYSEIELIADALNIPVSCLLPR